MNELFIHTLGCKVNYADMQSIGRRLRKHNVVPAALIGTCCVTAEGEKQSRKEVRRALKRVGPEGKVFVAGCAARLDPDAFAGMAKNVYLLTDDIVEVESRTGETGESEDAASCANVPKAARTRSFLKVQDGCANMCSYCVLPLVRGRPRSIPFDEVLENARSAVAEGYPEIVVTGINTGSYQDGRFGLSALLERLSGIDGLIRLRLSSVEVNHLSDDLLDVISHSDVFGRHIHLPLQSGDDSVLKAMRRRYDTAFFSDAVRRARRAMPDINLTTDVITGFPAEDERAFGNTIDFIRNAGFSKVHVFSYSPRPGTMSERLGDPVPASEKRLRSERLRELSGRLQEGYMQRKLGHVDEILLESEREPGVHAGYSSDYTRYIVVGGHAGVLARVRGESVKADGMWGKVIKD